MTVRVCVVHHSGYGHTARQAAAVAEGVRQVAGVECVEFPVAELFDAESSNWGTLDGADAIIFGCPTYMGSASADMKKFMELTSSRWLTQKWADKLAAGFTNSGSLTGDKQNTLVALMTLAAQHGMVWLNLNILPGNNSSTGSATDVNRLGASLGAMAQSNVDQGPDVVPPEADLETARRLGRRVAECCLRWAPGEGDGGGGGVSPARRRDGERSTMIYDVEVETRPAEEQYRLDQKTYAKQIEYLFSHSAFYRRKLREAGFEAPADVGGLDRIAQLPFTEKDELRQTQATSPPFGEHLACQPEQLQRVFSTSGTTGFPCYLGLTSKDIDVYATNVARGYTAAGFSRGQRIVVGFNAGPFVAGAVYYGFDRIGCTVIPVGTGNTERLVTAVQKLGATGISCTPSYGLYLIDWCHEHGIDPPTLGLENMITAGEPGGGDPLIRRRIEDAFGCTVRESLGIGDISLSTWAEDADGNGMNFMARGFVHVELIDPETGDPIPWEDGARGELVYTALQREAMPLLRFRSRDHVVVTMKENPTGRTGPRIRCIGRTDDMLIVRGVNLFPSAIREILNAFSPDVSGMFQIRPKVPGVAQSPPLPLVVELGREGQGSAEDLERRIADAIRTRLLVSTAVSLVPYGALPRETYKTKLVAYSAGAEL